MDRTSPAYTDLIERVTQDLVARYHDTFARETVLEVVTQARTALEATTRHPEFVPALLEHHARDLLLARAQAQGRVAKPVPVLLFVCEHNEGRSQSAAALAAHLGGEHVQVRSAGVHPTGALNPSVVAALAERGVRLDHAFPTPLHGDVLHAADVVVRLGCDAADSEQESGRRYVDWPVADPHGRPLEQVRGIVADVETRVRGLLRELDVPLAEGAEHEPSATPAPSRRRWSPARLIGLAHSG